MPIYINEINEKYFEINNIKYPKIYQPLKQGSTSLSITNVYDTNNIIINKKHYSEFIIDSTTYSNQKQVIDALLPIIYTHNIQSDIQSALELKTDTGGYNGTTQDLKYELDSKVFDGATTYQTLSDLNAVSPVPAEGTPAKVANDPSTNNNGYYSVVSGSWVKDSDMYEGLGSSLVFKNLDVNEAIDIRKIELYGADEDTTYFLKRAGNWYDPIEDREEALIEIASSIGGTVVCRFIDYGASTIRGGVELVDLVELSSSGVTGKALINWDALNGQFLTLNYPIHKSAHLNEGNELVESLYVELYGEELYEKYYRRTDGALIDSSDYNTLKINIEGITSPLFASARVVGTGTALAVYLDEDNALLGRQNIGTLLPAIVYDRVALTIPEGTKYVAIDNYLESEYDFGKLEMLVSDVRGMTQVKSMNQWYGKTIVGIGTSVMFGRRSTKSYIFEAARKLNFNLINTALAGQAIHAQDLGGGLEIVGSGSSVLSISEYSGLGTTIASDPIEPIIPNGEYNNHYRTWENIFKEANSSADLYIYAVAPNNTDFNTTDWDDFNKSTWSYNTGTFEDHRETFLGALIFMFNKMYEANPNARAVFVLDSKFNIDEGRANFETFANEFGFEIIDLWKKCQYNPKTKALLFSEGGTNTHPSSLAHLKMGEMLVNELLLIS